MNISIKNFKIGIIGQGFVGNALFQKFKDFTEVYTYDIISQKSNSTLEEIAEKTNYIFICLPTPMSADGSCNTSILIKSIDNLIDLGYESTIIIKSTIIPGTTDSLNKKYKKLTVIHNPEFLTEKNAVNDFKNQNRIVLGGELSSITHVAKFYSKLFPKATIIKTNAKEAEMIKYITNTFLACKVSYANEIFKICQVLRINYDKVIKNSMYDERLGKTHWSVPGHDGDFGYGGICFPKDMKAFIKLFDELNVDTNILKAADKTNDEVRLNKDWESMKGRSVL